MQKTLLIDGKSYPVKSTARSMLEYRAQFGSDFFADLETLQRSAEHVQNGSLADFGVIELQKLYNMTWLLMKKADPSLPSPDEWLDSFDRFPIVEVLPQVIEMFSDCMKGNVEVKNA